MVARIRPEREGAGETEGDALTARVRSLEAELEALRSALDASERRRSIERALFEADAIDVEAATLLAEAALEGAEGEDAVAGVISQLRENRPYLFRSSLALGSPGDAFGGTVMGAAPSGVVPGRLDETADTARASGDRRELLRYLRLRRGAG